MYGPCVILLTHARIGGASAAAVSIACKGGTWPWAPHTLPHTTVLHTPDHVKIQWTCLCSDEEDNISEDLDAALRSLQVLTTKVRASMAMKRKPEHSTICTQPA